MELSTKLTQATIDLWIGIKKTLLPTPSRFHYVFNLRDLSRIFQGMLSCQITTTNTPESFVGLWKHECIRVLADKLCRKVDKEFVEKSADEICAKHFGDALAKGVKETPW